MIAPRQSEQFASVLLQKLMATQTCGRDDQ